MPAKTKPKSSASQAGRKLALVPDVSMLQRQPNESVQAWEAWRTYIDVKTEITDRKGGGLREVGIRLKKSTALIGKWSLRFDWPSRYRLYQNEQMLLQEREQSRAIREKAKVWAGRKIDIRDRGFDVGEKLIKRGELLIALPVAEKEVKKTVTATHAGQEIETVTIYNFQQHPRDAKGFIEAGIKLMRLSAEMVTDNIGLQADDLNLDGLDELQLKEYIDELQRIREKVQDG